MRTLLAIIGWLLLASPAWAVPGVLWEELKAAGVAQYIERLDFQGQIPQAPIYRPGVTPAQRAAVEAVITAHNPNTGGLNVAGFKVWLKANLSFDLWNKVERAYPGFTRDLEAANWPYFQAGVIAAKADAPLTNGQWMALKNAVTTYKLPITLP